MMSDPEPNPELKPLHSDLSLIPSKLDAMEKWSTEMLLASLSPDRDECLKTRPDGTILDGHHRIYLLRKRGVDVDSLPRQILEKEDETI